MFFLVVMLQPFDYKDAAENKRHKFLVQSILPTEEIAPNDIEALVSIQCSPLFLQLLFTGPN